MYSIEQNKIIFNNDYNQIDFVEIIQNHNEIKIDEVHFGSRFNQDISFLPQYIKKIDFNFIYCK